MNCSIEVTPRVLKPDGTIVVHPTEKNLILDRALYMLIQNRRSMSRQLTYFYIGSGDAPNFRQSVIGDLSCSISTLNSTLPFFTQADADGHRVIQFNDNSKCRIETYVSSTEVLIDEERNFVDGDAIIWDVDRVAMDSYTFRSGTKYGIHRTDFGNEYELVNGVIDETYIKRRSYTTRRFDFPTAGTLIKEIGWSYDSDSTNYLGGRLVLDTPLVINAAEMLLLTIAVVSRIPVGPVSADPFFGKPAIVSARLTDGVMECVDYISSYNTALGTYPTPFLSPHNTEFHLSLSGSPAIVKADASDTKSILPYSKKWDLSFSGLVSANINSISVGSHYTAYNYTWRFATADRPTLAADQLFRLHPEVTIDRTLPLYPGLTPVVDPPSIPVNGAAYVGEEWPLFSIPSFRWGADNCRALCLTADKIYIGRTNDDIYEFDRDGKNEVRVASGMRGNVESIVHDGTYFYIHHGSDDIYKYDSDWNDLGLFATIPESTVGSLYIRGTKMYVIDSTSDIVREIDLATGVVSGVIHDFTTTEMKGSAKGLVVFDDTIIIHDAYGGSYPSELDYIEAYDRVTGVRKWSFQSPQEYVTRMVWDPVDGAFWTMTRYGSLMKSVIRPMP